jgi:hypothetical protein
MTAGRLDEQHLRNTQPLDNLPARRRDEDHASRRHAALSFASIGPALAAGGQGTVANTFFTELPGVIAHAPAPNAPVVATAHSDQGQATQVYVTRSNRGTWLFAPNANQGANS